MAIKIFVLSLVLLSLCQRSLCFDDNDIDDDYDHKFDTDDDDDDKKVPVKDEKHVHSPPDLKKECHQTNGTKIKEDLKSEDKKQTKKVEEKLTQNEDKISEKSEYSNNKKDYKLTKIKSDVATPRPSETCGPSIKANTVNSDSNPKKTKSNLLEDTTAQKPKIQIIKPKLKIASIIPGTRRAFVCNNKIIKPAKIDKEKSKNETEANNKNNKMTQSDHQNKVDIDTNSGSHIIIDEKEKVKNVDSKGAPSKVADQSDKQPRKNLSEQKKDKPLYSDVLRKGTDATKIKNIEPPPILANKTVDSSNGDNLKTSIHNSDKDEEDDEDSDSETIESDVIPCGHVEKINEKSLRDNITSKVLPTNLNKPVKTDGRSDTKEKSGKKPTLPIGISNLKNILQFRKAPPKTIKTAQPTTIITPRIISANPVNHNDLINHLIISNEDVKELSEKPKIKANTVESKDYTCFGNYDGQNYNTWNANRPITQEVPNANTQVEYTYGYPNSNAYTNYGWYKQPNSSPSYWYQAQNTGTENCNNYYSARTNPVSNWHSNQWYQWPQRGNQMNYNNQWNRSINNCQYNPGLNELSPATFGQTVPSITIPDKGDQLSIMDNPITSYNYQEVKLPYKNLERILRHWHKTQVLIKRNKEYFKSYQN